VLTRLRAKAEQRWFGVAPRQAEIRSDAEARIARRRWSTLAGGMEIRPYYDERFEQRAVRLRSERPDNVAGWVEYGLDELGRRVSVRQPGYEGPFKDQITVYGECLDEVFDFEWVPEWARESRGEHYKLVSLEQFLRDDTGRLERTVHIVRGDAFGDGPTRVSWEDYVYRGDGVLSQVVAHRPIDEQAHAIRGLAVGDVAVTRDDFTYDVAGDLISIRRVPAFADEEPWIVWRRRPASLRPAARKVEDALVEYTVGWAREHWPDEPVYCLGLVYRALSLGLDAAFGTQSFMERWLADQGGDGVILDLWNPAEFGIEHTFAPGHDDPEFAEAVSALEQEWRLTGDDQACLKLLAKTAKRINADARINLPRTDAFLVYVIDPEMIHDHAFVERHLRACVSADGFKRLRRTGLI